MERNGRKWIMGLLAALAITVLCPFASNSVHASTISQLQEQIKAHQKELEEANKKADDLKDKQALIEEMIDDLNAEILNTMTCIALREDEIADMENEIEIKRGEIALKQEDIDQTEREYLEMAAIVHDADCLDYLRFSAEKGLTVFDDARLIRTSSGRYVSAALELVLFSLTSEDWIERFFL